MKDNKVQISLRDLILNSWKIYYRYFPTIFLIIIAVNLPLNIITSLLAGIKGDTVFFKVIRYSSNIVGLLDVVATLAIIYLASCSQNEEKPDIKTTVNISLKKWGIGFIANLLQGIIIFFLLLLFIIPGIVWMVYYSFVNQAVVLSDLKGKDALDYSKYIVKGNWWRILGYGIVLNIVPILLAFIFNFVFKNYNRSYDDTVQIAINTIINLLTAFSTIGMTILFIDTEKLKPFTESEPMAFEKFNSFINKESVIDETSEQAEDFEDNEDEDENALYCSVCGIKVAQDDLICPLCRSVVRRD